MPWFEILTLILLALIVLAIFLTNNEGDIKQIAEEVRQIRNHLFWPDR
jgi:hypothetical protein